MAEYDTSRVVVVSVNVINRKGRVAAEAKAEKINYSVLLGRGTNITRDYKVSKLPHLFIIDANGIIQASELYLPFEKINRVLQIILAGTTAKAP